MVTITSGAERWAADSEARGENQNPFADCAEVDEAESPESGGSIKRVELAYQPFTKQKAFHRSPAKYRLFGGAAGPGKSKALLMEAILQAHEHPGADTMLLRRTFPELEQSLLLYFRRDVPREMYKSFHESKHVVTWWNGSTTRFGYCARENDVYQYQGSEFLFIGIDELTLFTLRQWQFLTSRNRCPVAGAFPCMAGATNPGNIGHAWVKALWIDREPAPGMENPSEYDPADYDFIAARIYDNPIYERDANYLKTLRALPSHLRRAFLDGDWSVFAGQYFDRFDVSRHLLRAEAIDWKPWWQRWISIDWGFEHLAAAYWHAAVPEGAAARHAFAAPGFSPAWVYRMQDAALKGGATKDAYSSRDDGASAPSVVTHREYVTHRTPPRELAREIIARSRDAAGERERIDAIYLSPDAFARRTDEASIAEQMGDVFSAAGMPRPVPADDDRVGGWMLMYQMLDAGEWLLTDNCVELIRTLPNLVRDPARIEDIEKTDGDDAADAARYGLKSRYGARRDGRDRMPPEYRIAERVTSTDLTMRAIQAREAQLAEFSRIQPVHFSRRRR
ncbi:MAG: hypothetical protein ACRD4S_01095 [Candidatus Acidiferrales bacterium]